MVLEVITLGVVGAAYITGDDARRAKMKKIVGGIVDVTKETASSTVSAVKSVCDKIGTKCKERKEAKKGAFSESRAGDEGW